MRFLFILAILCVLSAPLHVNAQGNRNGEITLDFEDVEIRSLIRFIAEATGRNFIVDNRVIGKVSVISPKPVDADEALVIFENLLAASGFAIVPAGNINRILPIAEAGKSAIDLIDRANARPGQIVTKLIRLQHIGADALLPVLEPLLSPTATLSAYLPGNTLVITENFANIEKVEALVARLDRDDTQTARNLDIVYLKNAEASALAAVLENIIQDTSSAGSQEGQLATFRGPVSIEADASTNALLISAEPGDMATLKDVINRLDIRRMQVYIEALIMEVSADLADQFGVEWRAAESISTNSGISPFGGQTFGSTGINQLAENPLNLPGGFAFGVSGGNITFRGQEFANIGFLLRAVRSDSNVNILSTPQLLTLDNEEAEIIVGENVPFITGSFDTQNNASNPFQTIEREDVGLTLRLRPQISENGLIRLNIFQEISSISNAQANASDLITRKRQLRTTVLVPDQQMVVLGGLIRDDINQANQQVPCLASIFGFGELFKSTSIENTKTNLMVFIKPRIINAHGTMDDITRAKYEKIRELQQQKPRGESLLVPYPDKPEPEMIPDDYKTPAAVSPTAE